MKQMIFDVNQTEFVSNYQKEVWVLGTHVIPLDVSLAKINDPELAEWCKQVYAVTMEILTDMYDNPQDYDCAIPNIYLELFFRRYADGKGSAPIKVKKQKELNEHILNRLERFGFVLNGGDLVNVRYPLFVKYRNLLNQSFDFGSTIPCDFRLLIKPYKRTTDDLLRPLSDIYKPYWRELFEYAQDKGAKLESRKDHMFRWVYDKRFVLILTNRPPCVEIPYRLNNGGGNIAQSLGLYLDLARNQPDANKLIKYIQDNLCVCNACNGQKSAGQRCQNWVDIDGKRRLAAICHTAIGRTKHGSHLEPYTAGDVEMLKRMIDLRIMQLDAEKT
ncbi:hypothetical protein FACS1894105_12100 [Clostridia bacterium]|nr:hypothetical protein FACS1894105_12100 [Clostridia bacterium]